MGVHHAWGRTYKDAYQRFFAMTGHELRYQNGFDCQGLWVEIEVERNLGFGTKTAIETYGIDKFVNACRRTASCSSPPARPNSRSAWVIGWTGTNRRRCERSPSTSAPTTSSPSLSPPESASAIKVTRLSPVSAVPSGGELFHVFDRKQ